MEKKLYRIPSEAKLGGVAAGLARYFDIDATLVRVLWAASLLLPIPPGFFMTGILYIILWAVLPEASGDIPFSGARDPFERPDPIERNKQRNDQTVKIAGLALIAFGGIMLLNRLNFWDSLSFYFWPLALISVGAFILLRQRDEKLHSQTPPDTDDSPIYPVTPDPGPEPDPTPVRLFGQDAEVPGNKPPTGPGGEAPEDDDVIKVN